MPFLTAREDMGWGWEGRVTVEEGCLAKVDSGSEEVRWWAYPPCQSTLPRAGGEG